MKKILVPYDFSRYATNAMDFAGQIAKSINGEIILLHVIDPPMGSSFNTYGEIELEDQTDKLYMLKLIEKTEETLNVVATNEKYESNKIDYKVVVGNPFESISKEISDSDVDLIVMGTKGSTGLEEYLLGSNTEKVVRFANCPVLSVPNKVNAESIKNIAFATNLEDDQDFIVKELQMYQHLFGATLHLVWVNTFQVNQDLEMVKNKLNELAERNELTKFEVHIYNAINAERGIMHFAEWQNMDMIALATHGHKGLAHLFIGSIAEDIVNQAKRPVWTYSTHPKA
ncbi:MAG: universal stress protein [Reichenbachiella sp.]|uniref:universal stress protein n=2 Tax=Reichenbachiella sp. TaxID=2184521 RepID=UPI0032647076